MKLISVSIHRHLLSNEIRILMCIHRHVSYVPLISWLVLKSGTGAMIFIINSNVFNFSKVNCKVRVNI